MTHFCLFLNRTCPNDVMPTYITWPDRHKSYVVL